MNQKEADVVYSSLNELVFSLFPAAVDKEKKRKRKKDAKTFGAMLANDAIKMAASHEKDK